MIHSAIALACLVWYLLVLIVCAIGIFQIRRTYVKKPAPSVSSNLPLLRVPHVTIIRPVKGLEPYLYECLAAIFHQIYPRERLTIYFCIFSHDDPAFPVLEQLMSDFPLFDAHILVEEESSQLSCSKCNQNVLGPNPKIRNMSRAYREAKGDLIWIIDCNVWVSSPVLGRLVDLLCGFTPTGPGRKYKFVHQLPLLVDISSSSTAKKNAVSCSTLPADPAPTTLTASLLRSGGLLEELFLSTSHAKFYIAISTVAIAPCIVGKSNMFRRSHLNSLTMPTPSCDHGTRDPGIDFFSDNICEDHLIGDLLWHSHVPSCVQKIAAQEGQDCNDTACLPEAATFQPVWGNHALLPPHPSNLVTQPTVNYPLISYIDRRTRWLRVRKFTVTMATLVEPGTESFLCSVYGAFAFTTLPWCNDILSIPRTWTAFWIFWLLNIILWAIVDRWVWSMLQHGGMTAEDRPSFGRPRAQQKMGLRQWTLAWLGREMLAFPIWIWAVVGGVTVVWRGRKFWVGTDMRVHEIEGESEPKRD